MHIEKENNTYKISNEGLAFIKQKIFSYTNTKIFGPLIFSVLNFILVISFNLTAFFGMLMWFLLTILTSLICLIIANKAINKYKQIIIRINFNDNIILSTTSKDIITIDNKINKSIKPFIVSSKIEYDMIELSSQSNQYYLLLNFFDPKLKEKLTA